MDWFNAPQDSPPENQHPDKISIKEAIERLNRRKISIREEKERLERERINAQKERLRARKEYLENKYGKQFTLDELEEFESVFQAKITQEREKEKKLLKMREAEERQLKRDMFR